jgi:hypothetical protein
VVQRVYVKWRSLTKSFELRLDGSGHISSTVEGFLARSSLSLPTALGWREGHRTFGLIAWHRPR